jgi:hypothetical protein
MSGPATSRRPRTFGGEVETAANIVPLAGSFAAFLRGFGPDPQDDDR